jgi:hypothetical protein
LVGHDVDQFFGNDHYPFYLSALEPGLNPTVLKGRQPEVFLSGIRGKGNPTPQFAIHLNHHQELLSLYRLDVIRRPRLLKDASAMSKALPEFLCQMGSKRGKEDEQRLDGKASHRTPFCLLLWTSM